jgi:outer membrane protein
MKKLLFKSFLFSVCLASSCFLCQAQTKVATIDLKKVFDNYYKTKQADSNLKERASDFDKTRKGMLDDYQTLNERYKKELESANDQAVSSDERDRRKKQAESTLLEIKRVEQDVTRFDQSSRNTLGEMQRRMRDNILREIREIISTRARQGSYSLVVDTAAETFNQTPVFLYSNSEHDMTDEILKQLNANAPAESSKPAETKEKTGEKK